jgi:hypothetical protein
MLGRCLAINARESVSIHVNAALQAPPLEAVDFVECVSGNGEAVARGLGPRSLGD